MAPVKDRRFTISETTRHREGFTVYKVISLVFPNSSHQEISKVSVWKRYNDFKKLHLELSKLHKRKGIKENFPSFPKSKYFQRFEAEVIEERRKSALKFLEFVGRYSYLYSSPIFINFFETCQMNNHISDCARSLNSDTSEEDAIITSQDSQTLSGTTQNTFQVSCLPRTSHDPYIKLSTSDLQYESTIPRRKNESHNITHLQNADIKKDEHCSRVSKMRLRDTVADYYSAHVRNRNFNNNVTTVKNETECDTSNESISKNLSFQDTTMLDDKLNTVHIQLDFTHYILVAAGHINAAHKHESIAEYNEAFIQYRFGISCLIDGVQFDPDSTRAADIKNKISKYLVRTEQLYNRYLNCDTSVTYRPISELQNYKVLKIIGSVILALDVRTDHIRIIKTIEKSSTCKDNIHNYVLRRQIPYMVHLYMCIETETTIFLILQHASFGKLWDFLRLHYKSSDLITKYSCAANCFHKPVESNECIQSNDTNLITVVQGENYDVQVPTTHLLEKSQKLLQSVDATLKKSNFIAHHLNEFKELKYSENIKLSDAKIANCNNSNNINGNIFGENLVTKALIENNSLKDINAVPVGSCENLHVLNGTCTIINLSKNEINDMSCIISNSGTSTVESISANQTIYDCKNCNVTGNIFDKTNININNVDNDYNTCELRYSCKEHNSDEGQILWQISEATICSWAAEILSALEALHQQAVLILDFKPDNILLDNMGHIRLTYVVPQNNMELSKLTYPYSSPELTTFSPTILITSAADIWSFGIILYELFTGIMFVVKHPGLFHSHSTINIPNKLSENAKSLLRGMLKYYPDERLTIDEIKRHPFFAEIDWPNIINYEM